jgi:hypothetical protein
MALNMERFKAEPRRSIKTALVRVLYIQLRESGGEFISWQPERNTFVALKEEQGRQKISHALRDKLRPTSSSSKLNVLNSRIHDLISRYRYPIDDLYRAVNTRLLNFDLQSSLMEPPKENNDLVALSRDAELTMISEV